MNLLKRSPVSVYFPLFFGVATPQGPLLRLLNSRQGGAFRPTGPQD